MSSSASGRARRRSAVIALALGHAEIDRASGAVARRRRRWRRERAVTGASRSRPCAVPPFASGADGRAVLVEGRG